MSKLDNLQSIIRFDIAEVKFLYDQFDDEIPERIEPFVLDKLINSVNTLLLDLNAYKDLKNEKD